MKSKCVVKWRDLGLVFFSCSSPEGIVLSFLPYISSEIHGDCLNASYHWFKKHFLTDFRFSRWLITDGEHFLSLLHRAYMDNGAESLEEHVASISLKNEAACASEISATLATSTRRKNTWTELTSYFLPTTIVGIVSNQFSCWETTD